MEEQSKVEKVAEAMSSMQVIASAAVGYRRTLIEGGVSEAVADSMVQEWHTTMMEVIKVSQTNAAAAVMAQMLGKRR